MLSLAAAAGLSEPGPSSSSQPAALQAPPAAWSALLGPANHEFAHLLSPAAEHAGHGGRPSAPGPSRPRAPGTLNPSPFFAPPLMGASGAATGTTPDYSMGMMMPLMSFWGGGRAPPPYDPNAVPAIKTMLTKGIGEGGGDIDKAIKYGNIIAGMGGVHGLRGHSLKRLAGCAQDPMMAGEQELKDLNPFKKK